MDASVNTKPSTKKVREWPKIDFLNFFVKSRELIAEKLGKGKAYIPALESKVGQSRIDEKYNRYNVTVKDGKRKIVRFFKPSKVTSSAVKKELDVQRTAKFPKTGKSDR